MPINPKLVHAYRLTDPIEARPGGAWVLQYHGESFLIDPGGGNPEPFAWSDQPHEALHFEMRTREEIAGLLRVNPAKLGFVKAGDPTFPAPLLEFRDGPVWSAAAIDAWAPTPAAVPPRERNVPTR